MKQIKNLLLIAFLSLIIGCSKDSEPFVDPVFDEFLAEFESQANLHGVELSETFHTIEVRLSDDIGNFGGQCITYSDGRREIVVNQSSWNRADQMAKELLLFHELGHCILDRGHVNDKDEYGQCVSIMRESTSTCPISYNLSSKEEYLDELFQ